MNTFLNFVHSQWTLSLILFILNEEDFAIFKCKNLQEYDIRKQHILTGYRLWDFNEDLVILFN